MARIANALTITEIEQILYAKAPRRFEPEAASPAPITPPQLRPCEICGQVIDRGFEFLRKYQYEITVSPEAQRGLAERGGFCSFHTWQYESIASPRGTCIGFPAVLDQWAAQFRKLAASSPSAAAAGAKIGSLFPQPETCVLCGVRAAAEAEVVASVAARLRQRPDDTLTSLSALCLPHFRLVAASVDDAETLRRLVARQAALLERLSEDMRRYALKHDGIRRFLASDEETNAAQRAMLLLAGHRTVNTPSRR